MFHRKGRHHTEAWTLQNLMASVQLRGRNLQCLKKLTQIVLGKIQLPELKQELRAKWGSLA